jgi:hypothetical protein
MRGTGLEVANVHVRRAALEADEDDRLPVVLVLAPALVRVVVALGARQPHGEERIRKLVYKSPRANHGFSRQMLGCRGPA